MADETFEVQPACWKPERKFSKIYHDFLDSSLEGKEKLIYILLKRYMDYSLDQNGGTSEVFPSLKTLEKQTGWTRQTISKILHQLEDKGVLKIVNRGLTKPNLYILQDFESLWKAGSSEELAAEVQNYKMRKLEELAEDLGYQLIDDQIIKKEPVSSTDQSIETRSYKSTTKKNTTVSPKSQDFERYSMNELKDYYNYGIMMQYVKDGVGKWPLIKDEIDVVFNILYDTLNTQDDCIRIGKDEKPTMTVISRLLNLNYESIAFAILKFNEQSSRINHVVPYMLKLLYHAPEQFRLDMNNLLQYNMRENNSEKMS